MHCVDVIRELSAPTAECDPAALAEHLAGCPRCASWAEQSTRLDGLWGATRPAQPSAAAWDRIWANITAALARLSPSTRATFVLHHEAGLSYIQVAEALEIPIGTVMSRLFYAGRSSSRS